MIVFYRNGEGRQVNFTLAAIAGKMDCYHPASMPGFSIISREEEQNLQS